MQIKVKEGVVFKELNGQLFHLCATAASVFKRYKIAPTITSANDGKHLPNSYHYKNLAWDLRVWGLPNPKQVAAELSALLNIKEHDFDVIFAGNHIHIEYDPKGGK